jgi:acyl-coenzyme A thioesterase 13
MLKPHFKIPVHSSDSSPEDRVRTVIATFADDPNYRGFDTEGLQTVKCVAASPETKTVAFEMTITPILCNKNRVLHGGAAAMLLDMLTSTILGMLSKPGYLDKGHVSRTLTTTYLRPVPMGAKVKVECHAVAIGRSMANLSGVIKTMDGKVCVTCVHDKVVFQGSKL